jgi:biopolymer transport protein ExbD
MKSHFRKLRRDQDGSLNELNITPLLDLVFVLLVIFIITTPQMTNSLEVNLPSGKQKPPPANAPKPKINRIYVNERGQAFLNQQPLALPDLKEALRRIKAADPDPGVVIEGADEVEYQNMVTVIDLLQQLDINKLGLATEAAVGRR